MRYAYVPRFDMDDAIRHDVTCVCNTCGAQLSAQHEKDCPADRFISEHAEMAKGLILLRAWLVSGDCSPPVVAELRERTAALLARFPETT